MIRALVLAAVITSSPAATTDGAIALANLDAQLAQPGDELDRVDLLLARARFLGDTDALDRAVRAAEAAPASPAALVLRARTRGAVHRFGDALADLAAAERAGARVATERATIQIALGRPGDALAALQAELHRAPGYASYSALAAGYASLGAYATADALYAAAVTWLAAHHATSPLPYAWISFARGVMWAEQAGDAGRGERHYRDAVAYLPAFYAANVHLAELEAARGDTSSARARLAPLTAAGDPEALGLRARLALDAAEGARDLAAARARYTALLARSPLAFADHAAELLVAIGAYADALPLARLNLANRPTRRAARLVLRACLGAAGRGLLPG